MSSATTNAISKPHIANSSAIWPSKPMLMIAMLVGLSLASLSSTVLAESVQGAVVTRTEGETKLMIKKIPGAPQPAGTMLISFEKENYYVRPAKNGDRPANGDIVATGKDGKVRLIYRNGDQVTVTPGTALKISWNPATDKNALAELVYGDIRAVIQPDGPRSGMKVKTKSAVMGVRGTDFFVSAWGNEGGSKVAVMRGKVAVAVKPPEATASPEPVVASPAPGGKAAKKLPAPPEKPHLPEVEPVMVDVVAGTTGVIKSLPAPVAGQKLLPAPPAIEISSTSKQELVVIQQDSKVAKAIVDPKDKIQNAEAAKQAAEIEKLEQVSVETALQDVKKYDLQLYAKLKDEQKSGKPFDADVIQAETVKKIFVVAPSEKTEARKPTIQDLDTGGDIYDKYKWERK